MEEKSPRTIEELRGDTLGRLRALRSRHGTPIFLRLVAEVLELDVAPEAFADLLAAEIRKLAEADL